MTELENYNSESFNPNQKSTKTLFLCSESSITCVTFRHLQQIIAGIEGGVVLAMPQSEYQKGKRGWAKAHILASVASQISGVMTLDYEEAIEEIQKGGWANIKGNGNLSWSSSQTITQEKAKFSDLKIIETEDPFDKEMISRSKKIIETSNCWLDPAGAVFVRGKDVLIESTSTSFNNSYCHDIPISFKDIPLEEGERMIFCDSLHAERVGISRAAEIDIQLEGSTMYVSKFPCRPCAMSAIAAGISTIVFEKGSYGLIETADLFEANNITLKKVRS
ncbi:hypothetical protein BH10PAT1_BH10PAT1_0370 [soil metagenome]